MSNTQTAALAAAAPDLLEALTYANEFIKGHNECLDKSSGEEWIAYCVGLQEQCQKAINKATTRR